MIEICPFNQRCLECPLPGSVVVAYMDENWLDQGVEVSPEGLQQMYDRMDTIDAGNPSDELHLKYVKLVVGLAQLRVISGLCPQVPVNIR